MKLPFIGSSYKARSIAVNGQECVNFYLEYYGPKEEAKTVKALLSTPGLDPFAISAVNLPMRGLYTTSTGRMFGVSGSKLYEYMSNGRMVEKGTLLTNSGSVNFADNGNGNSRGRGMILVDNSYGYMLNLTDSVFQQIKDPSFPTASHVVFLDGYFIVNEVNSAKIWLSNLYNGLDWGDISMTTASGSEITTGLGTQTFTTVKSLDISNLSSVVLTSGYSTMSGTITAYDDNTGIMSVNVTSVSGSGTHYNWIIQYYTGSTASAVAESSPDNLMAIHSIHGELWLVGAQTTEVWYQSGNPTGFPFQRIHGALINNGTVAKWSVQSNGSNLFWLGSSAQGHGQAWMSEAYQPRKISTPAIDHMIESLSNITDAVGLCYTQEGHNFYLLTFEDSKKTLCYDLTTDEWHERGFWNTPAGRMEHHLASCLTFAFNKNYVGDRRNGNVYELSLVKYTDNGDIVRRVRTGPHIHQDRKRIRFNTFEIDIERGVGLDGMVDDSTPGKIPKAFLQWSDDGGITWSNEYWNTFGAIGKYKQRLRWHRLGMSRDRIFRVGISDPVKVVLVDARADTGIEQDR